jgi:GTP-binding protein YchF
MLNAGIVGLPNVGKSTLFNALLKNFQAEAANFPFCTIEPNVGIVNVPDFRLTVLKAIYGSEKIIPASFQFVDIAGLVKGASEGAGLGNKFLSHIREVDAIIQVVRCFEDENVHHVDGSVDPVRDFETIGFELMMADLAVVKKRIERLAKQVKSGDKLAEIESLILQRIEKEIEELNPVELNSEEKEVVRHLNLLINKPVLLAANLKEEELKDPKANANFNKIVSYLNQKFPNVQIVPISAQIEAELSQLAETEAKEYLDALGVKESGVEKLIQTAFSTLGLMSYFTAGEVEARAWTIPIGCKAPQAAGVIHTDFGRGFIKAEVVGYDDLVEYGSKKAAQVAGKVRLEGKDYVMQNGDVVEFKFNV